MQNDLTTVLIFSFAYFGALIYGIVKYRLKDATKENGKPIIRHCKNCKWHLSATMTDAYCDVKYKFISNGKKGARFCRYYKAKEGGKNE